MSWKRWVREIEIEPSLYAGDFLRLGEQIDHLSARGPASSTSTSATATSSSR